MRRSPPKLLLAVLSAAMAASGAHGAGTRASTSRKPQTATATTTARELQTAAAATTATTDRVNFDPSTNTCKVIPGKCVGGASGGNNCNLVREKDAPGSTNRNAESTSFPRFSTDTCIYEEMPCREFRSLWEEAEINYVGGTSAKQDRYYAILDTGSNGPAGTSINECFKQGGKANQKGVCCRLHASAWTIDEAMDARRGSFSSLPCICNDFTYKPVGGFQ